MGVEEAEERATGRVRGLRPVVAWPVAVVGGAATGVLGVVLLARAWRSCDVGVNAAANSFVLVPVLVGLTAVTTAWWRLTLTVLARRCGVPFGLVCAVVGSLVLLWGALAWLHAPADYPAPLCPPDNVPPWWPEGVPL